MKRIRKILPKTIIVVTLAVFLLILEMSNKPKKMKEKVKLETRDNHKIKRGRGSIQEPDLS